MQYLLINHKNIIQGIFDRKVEVFKDQKLIALDTTLSAKELIGRKTGVMDPAEMKIAIICNWRTPCGISTYSEFLVEALKKKVKKVKIFSEIETKADTSQDDEENVVRCWKRGESMLPTIQKLKEYAPDFVLVQHEFGIFPKATHFIKLLEGLNAFPHAIVLHSVYANHLDKTICTSIIKNIIVHSEEGKKTLDSLGHTATYTQVIPHGCRIFNDTKELWNIFQTPYAIVQFGFGFFYKGVDRAIEAIGYLKQTDSKFKDIFYCYLCSESANAVGTHAHYQEYLESLIEKYNLHDNVAIIRKYQSEESINNYLRTAKLALFPYVTDPQNIVFGASGAARIAMANNIPVVASESHMFDDLEGILPRPNSAMSLAKEIDRIFSDEQYKKQLIERNQKYIQENTWDMTAQKYVDAIKNIMEKENYLSIAF